MPELWFDLVHGPHEPAANMAWDAALLEAAARLGRPILRTYGWRGAAATFGYFQRWRDVAAMTPLRPLIRRPTGGGLVRHENDWTYAVAIPAGHPWYWLRAAASYERLHTWLRHALERLGVATQLAPAPQLGGPGQCFIGAERHDLLHQGRKLAGAAQRRARRGLLIQGSVQPAPASLSRAAWHAALRDAATADWGVRWEPLPPGEVDQCAAAARRRAAAQFSRSEYNERR